MEGDSVKFKNIKCGYNHALMVDEKDNVYAFGGGFYGQLGTGVDFIRAKVPTIVADVSDELDKATIIACGAHFSICYSELGILYYWGMLIPDVVESIQWVPNFMSISLPHGMTEMELLSF